MYTELVVNSPGGGSHTAGSGSVFLATDGQPRGYPEYLRFRLGRDDGEVRVSGPTVYQCVDGRMIVRGNGTAGGLQGVVVEGR